METQALPTQTDLVNFASPLNQQDLVNFAEIASETIKRNDEYSRNVAEELYDTVDVDAAEQMAADDYIKKEENRTAEKMANGSVQKAVLEFSRIFDNVSNEEIKGIGLPAKKADTEMSESEVGLANAKLYPSRSERLDNWKTNYQIDLRMRDITKNTAYSGDIVEVGWQIAQRFVPLVEAYKSNVLFGGSLAELPGDKVEDAQRQLNNLKEVLTPVEYNTFTQLLTKSLYDAGNDNIAVADFWDKMTTINSGVDNAFAAIDAFGIMSAAKSLVRVGGKVKDLNKASKISKYIENNDVAKIKSEETLQSVTANAVSPAQVSSDYAQTSERLAEHALDTEALDKVADVVRFTPEADEETTSRMFNFFKNNFAQRYHFSAEEASKIEISQFDDTHAAVVVNHGAENAEPFVSNSAAEAFASRHFMPGTYSIENSGDGFKIVAKIPLEEVGVSIEDITQGAKAWKKEGKPFKMMALKRQFVGRVPDSFHEADVMTVNARDTMKKILSPYEAKVSQLDNNQLDTLKKVLDLSEGEERWFDAGELAKTYKIKDEKIIEAYDAIHKIGDANYLVHNKIIRDNLVSKGYKAYKGRIAKEITGDVNYNNIAAKNLETGEYYSPGMLTKANIRDVLGEDKVLLKLRGSDIENIEEPFNYIILSRRNAVAKELPEAIIKYVGGPRRIYSKGTVFLKQFRSTLLGDGRELVLRPSVLAADTNVKAVKKMADELNDALAIYRNYKENRLTLDQATILLNERTAANDFVHAPSVKNFEDNWIKARKMNYRHSVEVVEDGEEMKSIRAARLRNTDFFDDVEDYSSNSLQNMLDDNGRFYNSRGPVLKTPFGNAAKTVSPDQLMSKTLNKMIYEHSTKEYNRWYANQVKRLFGDIIDPTYDYRKLSDTDFLKSVRFVEPANRDVRRKVGAARNLVEHWRTLSIQHTDFDNAVEVYSKGLADWLGERLDWFERGSKNWEWVASLRPDKWMRMMAFHMFLGCFNIRQAWLQAMGGVNAYLIHPTYAFRSFRAYGPMRMAAMTDDPAKLKKIAKTLVKMGAEKNVEDAEASIKFMKNAGGFGADSYVAADGLRMFDTNRFKKASTVFFREGEMFNRTQSYWMGSHYIADKYGVSMKQLASDSKLMKKAIGHADDVYLNMSSASPMAIQRGWKGLFSQFLRYPFAFLEAVTGKQLEPAQKLRLALGNFAMFGVEGLVGFGIYDFFKEDIPGFSPAMGKVLDKGIVTFAANQAGIPIDLSGEGPQPFEKLFQIWKSGGALDIVQMIPSAYVAQSLEDTLKFGYSLSKALLPGGSQADLMNALAHYGYSSKGLSGLRNYCKAAVTVYTHKLFSSNMSTIKDGATTADAIMQALGVRNMAISDYQRAFQMMGNTKEVYKDAMKDLKESYNSAAEFGMDPQSDAYKEYAAKSALIYATLNDMDPKLMMDAMREMNYHAMYSKIDPSLNLQTYLMKKLGMKSAIDYNQFTKGYSNGQL